MLVSSVRRNEFCPPVCRVGRGMWVLPPRCFKLGLLDGCSCDIGPPSSVKNIGGFDIIAEELARLGPYRVRKSSTSIEGGGIRFKSIQYLGNMHLGSTLSGSARVGVC
ncbi:hypothetical protein BHE74_00028583 [Ensete ventricosum]|nr:hypothetical protein GW17_00048442 [Ensete ventricosum]RWW64197.1 hypothetical protein BHE74_00028583 [Ensete ventricosum]